MEELEKAKDRTKAQIHQKGYDAKTQERLIRAVDRIFYQTAQRHY